jgi:hypothetical protein
MLGFNFNLIFKLNNNENILNNRKIECIDIPISIQVINKKNNLNLDINDKLFYKSKKLLFFNNKIYLSRAAQNEDKFININDNLLIQKLNEIKNIDLFINEDLDYSLIYENSI